MKFKVGDKVKLREDSEYWGQSDGLIGTIGNIQPNGWIVVVWGEYMGNSYKERDLDPIRQKLTLREAIE